jgi:hypothetical protein
VVLAAQVAPRRSTRRELKTLIAVARRVALIRRKMAELVRKIARAKVRQSSESAVKSILVNLIMHLLSIYPQRKLQRKALSLLPNPIMRSATKVASRVILFSLCLR